MMSRLRSLSGPVRFHAPALVLLLVLVGAVVLRINPPGRIAHEIRGADDYSVTYAIAWGHRVLWSDPTAYYRMPVFSAQDSPRFWTETGVLVQFLTVPLRWLDNPILAMHLVCMAGVVLSALAAYAAAFHILRNRAGAVAAAFVYACHGDMQYHLWSHPNIVAVFLIPVCLALQHRLLRGPAWWLALVQGILVFLQFTCSIYLGVILMAGLGCCWLAELLVARRGRVSRADAAILGGWVLALALAWIYTSPFRALSEAHGSQRGLGEAAHYSAGFGGWFLPTTLERFPRSIVAVLLEGRLESASRLEDAQFLGWTAWLATLACLVMALRRWWRGASTAADRHLLYILPAAIAGFILSLGPFLWIGDTITGIRLPFYHLLANLPPLQFFRAASRFSILVAWFVALGFGLGIRSMRANPRGWRWMPALAMGLIFLELFPVRVQPFRPHPPGAAAALRRHPNLRSVMPMPFADERFLIDSCSTFPESPSGTWAGVYNHHYRGLMELINLSAREHQVAILQALGVEAILAYGDDEAARLMADGRLSVLEQWPGGALLAMPHGAVDGVEEARAELARLATRPRLPDGDDFPVYTSAADRWVPGDWQWLDERAEPGAWRPMDWEDMAREGFTFQGLRQVFYSGLGARPLAEVAEVHVRLRLRDPGVDYVESRVFWLTEDDAGWTPARSAAAWIRADGRWQVVTFRLQERPDWDPAEILTALQFEPTTTPHPGQRVRISEIRLTGPAPEARQPLLPEN